MATDRTGLLAVPAAAALLLWPAIWNGYPIVFADTGTYLSQAIHRYAGWDRPVFYSLFMLPLHWTVTLWPVIVAQALLTSWLLWRVCRLLLGRMSIPAFLCGAAALAVGTWLPWLVSELMPDIFTPLLILLTCLLAWLPERASHRQQLLLACLATFMIAAQQSSLPLACLLLAGLGLATRLIALSTSSPSSRPLMAFKRRHPVQASHGLKSGGGPEIRAPQAPVLPTVTLSRRLLLITLPPALAILALCSVNLAAHGRFAVSPFGNIFLLARVIYDGPGLTALRADCPAQHWRLCPYIDRLPPTSDEFLWTQDSPLNLAGGAKLVSHDADGIIRDALITAPSTEARAALSNTFEQLTRFASGDGLTPWPIQVSPRIEADFPTREAAAYRAARQQSGALAVPPPLDNIHLITAVTGLAACVLLLPVALARRASCAGFLLAVLLSVPVNAAITGALSAPHERYQARIMWLPPFIAIVSLASLRRRSA